MAASQAPSTDGAFLIFLTPVKMPLLLKFQKFLIILLNSRF